MFLHCRIQLEKDNAPTREIVRLDNVVQNYKPIAAHSFNVSWPNWEFCVSNYFSVSKFNL